MLDWFKEINWVLSLAAAIPLSIVANLLTPKLQNWLAKRSTEKAAKRLADLESELDRITSFKNEKELLLHETIYVILKVVVIIGIGNAITSIPFTYIITDPIGAVIYLVGIMAGISHLALITKVKRFDEYQKTIEAQKESLRSEA